MQLKFHNSANLNVHNILINGSVIKTGLNFFTKKITIICIFILINTNHEKQFIPIFHLESFSTLSKDWLQTSRNLIWFWCNSIFFGICSFKETSLKQLWHNFLFKRKLYFVFYFNLLMSSYPSQPVLDSLIISPSSPR